MNVVHVFPYTPRLSGGHSNAIRSYIECQRASGVQAVGVAPATDEGAAPASWGFPLAEIDFSTTLRWETLARRFELRAGESLVHFHSVSRQYALLLGDLRRAGVPQVCTSHGQLNFRGAAHWLKKFIYLHCFNTGPRKAAGVHVLTNFAAHRLRLLLPGYRGKILVQGNLVSLADLAKSPAAPRSEYGLPPDAFVLLFLGRLDVRVKGLDLLLRAFAGLPADRYRLVLAGPDWAGGKAKLEQLAEESGCRNRLHFPGPVYGDKKWSLLRLADGFVSPSRWEAYGISLVEAMAAGVPLVTSNTISIAQDLQAAQAALVVPLDSELLARALTKLQAEPEARKALAARGQAWAETNCSPARAGARFRDFYQELLQAAPRSGVAHLPPR